MPCHCPVLFDKNWVVVGENLRAACQPKATRKRMAFRRRRASRVHKPWDSLTAAQRRWALMSPMPPP